MFYRGSCTQLHGFLIGYSLEKATNIHLVLPVSLLHLIELWYTILYLPCRCQVTVDAVCQHQQE